MPGASAADAATMPLPGRHARRCRYYAIRHFDAADY
jgi:hypothetical protein